MADAQQFAEAWLEYQRRHNILLWQRPLFVYLANRGWGCHLAGAQILVFGGLATLGGWSLLAKNVLGGGAGCGLLLRFAVGGSKLIVE
jgi:hypothetical protein